jgi:molybdopterin converting factor small subunit
LSLLLACSLVAHGSTIGILIGAGRGRRMDDVLLVNDFLDGDVVVVLPAVAGGAG